MKLFPAEISINEFDLEEVSIEFKGSKKTRKKILVEPEDVDYTYKIRKKRKKNKYKIDFSMLIENEDVLLKIKGYAVYSFPDEFNSEKIGAYMYGNVIPSIYSSLRGLLFLLTYHSPRRILLPVVNFYKSYEKDVKETLK